MKDIITSVEVKDDRVYISVSDGSLIQFGIKYVKNGAKSIEEEKPLMVGAEIIFVSRDEVKKFFCMEYIPASSGKNRYISFNY